MTISAAQTPQHAMGSMSSWAVAISFASSVTAGNALVVSAAAHDNADVTTVSVVDSNVTYTEAVHRENVNLADWAGIYYTTNAAGGANTVTMTANGSSNAGTKQGICIYELTNSAGSNTIDLDAGKVNSAIGTTGAIDSGSVTTTTANSAVIAVCDAYPGPTLGGGSGWTFDGSDTSWLTIVAGYESRFPTGTGTFTGDFSGSTTFWVAAIAAFKDTAAGGATRPVKMAGAWGGYAGESGGFAG